MKQKLKHPLPNQHRLSGSNKELEERCAFFHCHHPTPSIKKKTKEIKGDDEDPHRLIVPLLASLVILASYLAFSRLAFLIC